MACVLTRSCVKCGEFFHPFNTSDIYIYCTKCGPKPSEEEFDPVNKPKHYNSHPSGIQCIEVTRHMSFNIGNAFKYLWRSDLKNGIEDLEKAIWYIQDEIKKRKTGVFEK